MVLGVAAEVAPLTERIPLAHNYKVGIMIYSAQLLSCWYL